MTKPSKSFRIDRNSPSVRLARDLARADHQLLARLIQKRVDLGLSQTQLADKMGVSQPTVAAFERYDNDPKMSTVRRYAHALGVSIEHLVDDEPVTTRGPEYQEASSDAVGPLIFGGVTATTPPGTASRFLADFLARREPVTVEFEPSVIEYTAEDEPEMIVPPEWVR